MKKLLVLLSVIILSCTQATKEEPEYKNVAPTVEIEGSEILSNGQEGSYEAVITDPDDTEFSIEWNMQGNTSRERTVYFSATPENDSDYLLTVTVSDGDAKAYNSMLITVNAPVWQPEKLHVYILSEAGEILQEYQTTADKYASLYRRAKLTVDIHNRDYPEEIWKLEAGGI